MSKRLKVGNAVLCDYVGQGFANKHTIVNALSGNVVVQSFPTGVGFGMYIEIIMESGLPQKIGIEVKYAGDSLLKGDGNIGAMKVSEPGVLVIPHFEFRVEKEGILELVLSAEGYEPTTVMRKKIFAGPIPTTA